MEFHGGQGPVSCEMRAYAYLVCDLVQKGEVPDEAREISNVKVQEQRLRITERELWHARNRGWIPGEAGVKP